MSTPAIATAEVLSGEKAWFFDTVKENYDKIKHPENVVTNAEQKIDGATTEMMNKATEWISRHTPEWLKKIGAFLEKHFSFLKGIKDWFKEKISGAQKWLIGSIGWIIGIDLFKIMERAKNPAKPEQAEKPEAVAQIETQLSQAEKLLQDSAIWNMAKGMVNFVQETAGHLDKDMERNSFYKQFKDLWGNIAEIKNITPVRFITILLEEGFGEDKIRKLSQDFKQKGEAVFWTIATGGLFYEFFKQGKKTKTAIFAFILYGLDKKYSQGAVTEAVIDGTYGVTNDFLNVEAQIMEGFWATHLKEVLKKRQEYDTLEFLEKIYEAIKQDSIPAIFAGGVTSLYIGGKWLIWEPFAGYAETAKNLMEFKFQDAMTAVIEWQWPILVTAWAYTLIKTRGNLYEALKSAWKINLPRLALTHHWHIDVEMFLRKFEGAWYKLSPAMTEQRAIAEAQYLGKKAAYYEGEKAGKKALEDLETLMRKTIGNVKNWTWKIKEIPGIHSSISLNDNPAEIADKLKKDAHEWLNRRNLLQRKVIDPLLSKKSWTSTPPPSPENLKQRSVEIGKELEQKIAKYGEDLDAAHKLLIEAVAKGDKTEIEAATKLFEAEKIRLKNAVGQDFKTYGAEHFKAFKEKPLGHFGKLTLKGAGLVYMGFEGARIAKLFASGETKNAGGAAVDLAMRLAPITGTYMDGKDAWEAFKKGEVKQGLLSSGFAALGAVTDVLCFTGIGTAAGAGWRAGISALKAWRMALKTAESARVIGTAEKAAEGTADAVKTVINWTRNRVGKVLDSGVGILTARNALKLGTPALAIYLYEKLTPSEENIEETPLIRPSTTSGQVPRGRSES